MTRWPGRLLAAAVVTGGSAAALPAQSTFGITPMASAIGIVDHSDPVPGGGSLTEARVVQPVLMAMGHAFGSRLGFTVTLDLEGVTIPGGELTPGAWGEGFIDRRHPHTTFHELVVTGNDLLGQLDGRGVLSVIVGKGFVPFGSDDPMSRPFEHYPVNHHLAQLLERAVGIARYDIGRVTVEGALFNGDEPTRPSDWPLLRSDGRWRFGDSWSGRGTFRPLYGLELSGSLAHVHSPESRAGAGPDARKVALSARWRRNLASGETYAMAEWARTSELVGTFVFRSFLAEGMIRRGLVSVSYRFEQTDRPEEPRLFDLFRTPNPAPESSLVGISRWTLHTLHLALDLRRPEQKLLVQPFVEGTLGSVRAVGAGLFDPVGLYGTDQVRSIEVGVMVGFGMRGHRMGRYGGLADEMAMGGTPGMKM